MSIKIPGGSVELCPIIEQAFEKNRPKCERFETAYQACVKRLGDNPPRGATCEMQYFDYYRCLDKVVCVFVGFLA